MPAKRNSKSTEDRRLAANARPTPAKLLKEQAARKKYLLAMQPRIEQRYQDDKKFLRQLFDTWGGTDEWQWKIIDPLMAEAKPKTIYG